MTKKRALFALLPVPRTETQQIEMVYGQLHYKVTVKMPRKGVSTFNELLKAARGVEQLLMERVLPENGTSFGKPAPPAKPDKSPWQHKRHHFRNRVCMLWLWYPRRGKVQMHHLRQDTGKKINRQRIILQHGVCSRVTSTCFLSYV